MSLNDATISVRLPSKTRKALDKAARTTRRSRAFLIKEALDKHLPTLRPADSRAEIERKLKLIQELAEAGDRAGRTRSAEDIDSMIRFLRGDD